MKNNVPVLDYFASHLELEASGEWQEGSLLSCASNFLRQKKSRLSTPENFLRERWVKNRFIRLKRTWLTKRWTCCSSKK